MSTISPSANAPKSMSARLLTMKFMQRAVSSPAIPTLSSVVEPSPKRRKKETDSSPQSSNVDTFVDRNSVLDALAKEEEKSLVALEKLAFESGDTRWVLNYKEEEYPKTATSIRVVQTGYANLDSPPSQCATANETDEKPVFLGRRSFGSFNKVLEKQQNLHHRESSATGLEEDDNSSMDSSEHLSSADDSNDPTGQLIRSSRREAVARSKVLQNEKKKEIKERIEKQPRKRRHTEVSLNHLTSLSGRKELSPKTKVECYSCGAPHRKIDCPNRKRGRQQIDDGPPKKSFKFS